MSLGVELRAVSGDWSPLGTLGDDGGRCRSAYGRGLWVGIWWTLSDGGRQVVVDADQRGSRALSEGFVEVEGSWGGRRCG